MEIVPGEGAGPVRFGMTRAQVLEHLGPPVSATPYADQPGYASDRESLDFGNLSVLVTPDAGAIAVTVEAAGSNATLWGEAVFALTPRQAADWIGEHGHKTEIREEAVAGDIDITVPGLGLIVYCSEDALDSIEVFSPETAFG